MKKFIVALIAGLMVSSTFAFAGDIKTDTKVIKAPLVQEQVTSAVKKKAPKKAKAKKKVIKKAEVATPIGNSTK